MNAKFEVRIPLVPILVVVLCVVASAKTLVLRPLFDESFLLSWAKTKGMLGSLDFYAFSGVRPGDQWGPLTMLSIQISQVLSFGLYWLWRLHNIMIRAVGALAMYFAFKRLFGSPWLSLLAAALPPFFEPVGWLGQRGSQLATMFGSLSFLWYLKSRDVKNGSYGDWTLADAAVKSGLAMASYLAAIFSSFSAWLLAPVFALVEFLLWMRSAPERKHDGTLSLVLPLVPLVMAGAALAAIGFHPLFERWRPVSDRNLFTHARLASSLRSGLKQHGQAVVTDVPPDLAVSPIFASNGAILINPKQGTVSVNRISGGPLKDALNSNSVSLPCYRWDNQQRTLTPLYTPFPSENATVEFAAIPLANLFQPPVHFIPTAYFDSATSDIVIKAETPATGPVVKVTADWLNPMKSDFVWIEAKIDGDKTKVSSVDLYWVTALLPAFDPKFRMESTSAFVGDNQYHRYYFPIRSTNWYSSGQPQQLTIGFPAGSTIHVRKMGATTRAERMPQFSLLETSTQSAVVAPCIGFPSAPYLGCYVVPEDAKNLKAAISLPAGSAGVVVEISLPGKDFDNPNGTKLSGVTLESFPIETSEKIVSFPIENVSQRGIYAIRAIAMDSAHNFVGNFSDTLYVFIDRPNRLGWRTQ